MFSQISEDDHGFPSRVTRGLSSKGYFIPNVEQKVQHKDAAVKESEVAVSKKNCGRREEGATKTATSIDTVKVADVESETCGQKPAAISNVGEDKLKEKPDFRKALEEVQFALQETDFGTFSSEISPAETKKISASVFINDLRKRNEKVAKSIIQQIANFPMISSELLYLRFSMPENIAKASLDFLLKKGYLRKYKVLPGGEFYYRSLRLEKSLIYKDVSKFIGVRHFVASDLGKLEEGKASSAAARYAFLQLYTNSTRNYVEGNVKQHTHLNVTMTEAFLSRSYGISEPEHSEVLIGAFWSNYDECDDFIERFKSLINASKKINRFVIAAETRERAEKLANEIKKCGYEKLDAVSWFVYSLKEGAYYKLGQSQGVNIGEIWPALADEQDVAKKIAAAEEVAVIQESANSNVKNKDSETEEKEKIVGPEIEVEESETAMAESVDVDNMEAVVSKLINAKKAYCAVAYAKAMSLKHSEHGNEF